MVARGIFAKSANFRGKTIIVLGGGILGTVSAIILANAGARVILLYRDLQDTLSYFVNGGLAEPYASSDERNPGWFAKTIRALEQFAQGSVLRQWLHHRNGIMMSTNEQSVLPSWHGEVLAFEYPVPTPDARFPFASAYTTITMRPDRLMAHLHASARKAGVAFQCVQIMALEDVVRNWQPDGLIVATGLNMYTLWPDHQLDAGWGLVRVMDVPRPSVDRDLDQKAISDYDLREMIIMNMDMTAYSIPHASNNPNLIQLVVGGTNEAHLDPTTRPSLEQLKQVFRRNVVEGLPPFFTKLLDDVRGEWRLGGRPLRARVMIDYKNILGVPAVGIGGVGGSGMSIFAGVVPEAINLLGELLEIDFEPTTGDVQSDSPEDEED